MKRYVYENVKVDRVIDGDTIVVTINLGFKIRVDRLKLRLYGIDTPERGEPGFTEATDYLKDLLTTYEESLTIETIKDKADSFGRYLAVLRGYTEERGPVNLNSEMVKSGHAKRYER